MERINEHEDMYVDEIDKQIQELSRELDNYKKSGSKSVLWAVLLAGITGNTGTILDSYNSPVRHDSFTKNDASQLEARIIKVMSANRADAIERESKIKERVIVNEINAKGCIRCSDRSENENDVSERDKETLDILIFEYLENQRKK